MELDGDVVKKRLGRGSKSDHDAVFLRAGSNEYVLRRPGANPFEDDPELDALVGARVRVSGNLRGYTMFVSSWDILDKDRR